jgi:hypothetical protein
VDGLIVRVGVREVVVDLEGVEVVAGYRMSGKAHDMTM